MAIGEPDKIPCPHCGAMSDAIQLFLREVNDQGLWADLGRHLDWFSKYANSLEIAMRQAPQQCRCGQGALWRCDVHGMESTVTMRL